MPTRSARILFFLYNVLLRILTPCLVLLLRYRRLIGKEDPQRWREKMGQTNLNPAPNAPLLWCHAASVGEAKSILPLLNAFIKTHPTWQILLTTVTRTGFQAVQKMLPPQVRHQFAPLDHPAWVKKFLDHWQPQAAIWVEGELWPNQLLALKKRGVPAILINARMHPKSFATWQKWPHIIAPILNCFTAATAMSNRSASYYQTLGLSNIKVLGDIKMAAPKLLTPAYGLNALQTALGHRPRILLAQSHGGEEELLLEHFKYLEKQFPQLLLTIVPRHPTRTAQIVKAIEDTDLSFETRGDQHRTPSAATQVYVANTMGELGLFYATHNIVVMGGSFVDLGGHNPLEPAHFGCHIVVGPHMFNFEHMLHVLEPSCAIHHTTPHALPLALSALLAQADTERQPCGQQLETLAAQQQRDIIPQHLALLTTHFG